MVQVDTTICKPLFHHHTNIFFKEQKPYAQQIDLLTQECHF